MTRCQICGGWPGVCRCLSARFGPPRPKIEGPLFPQFKQRTTTVKNRQHGDFVTVTMQGDAIESITRSRKRPKGRRVTRVDYDT